MKKGDEHKHVLKKASYFIMQTQIPEALGRVVLEALSKGTPVIGSVNGSLPELINKNVGICSNKFKEISNGLRKTFDFKAVFEYSKKLIFILKLVN